MAPVVKNLSTNAGNVRDVGLIPVSGRSPEKEMPEPTQYSCLENPMDRGAWQATVHGLQWTGHDWSNLAHMHAQRKYKAGKGKWNISGDGEITTTLKTFISFQRPCSISD